MIFRHFGFRFEFQAPFDGNPHLQPGLRIASAPQERRQIELRFRQTLLIVL